MSNQIGDIVVHVDESLDEAALSGLEHEIREEQGVISVGHQPGRPHLLTVVYDTAVIPAADLLHRLQERGLHAQLIGF